MIAPPTSAASASLPGCVETRPMNSREPSWSDMVLLLEWSGCLYRDGGRSCGRASGRVDGEPFAAQPGRGGDQPDRVRMLRTVEHLAHRPVLGDPALVQHRDPVRDPGE